MARWNCILSLSIVLCACVLTEGAVSEQFAKVDASGAAWSRFPVDARGEAMGLATTVNPTGPTAFWWNPAPLPDGRNVDLSYTVWEYPFDDIDWRPLAARVSCDNITVGFVWSRLSVGPMSVRSAYDPEGSGESQEAASDLIQLGVAADLVPWLDDDGSPWTWTVGANLRYFREDPADRVSSAWDADLGSSVAWRAATGDAGWLRLHATVMVRNLTQATLDRGELHAILPRYYHLGAGLEAGLGEVWRGRRMIRTTVAFALHRDLEDNWADYDSEHLGFELTLANILSLRTGYRTRGLFSEEGWSWGGGLQYVSGGPLGLRAAVDYARFDLDGPMFDEDQDLWTFTVGMDSPR